MSPFPSIFVQLPFSLYYGEYVVRFPLPDGGFLPCDHGLDFLHRLLCDNLVNQLIIMWPENKQRGRGKNPTNIQARKTGKARAENGLFLRRTVYRRAIDCMPTLILRTFCLFFSSSTRETRDIFELKY